MEYEELEQDLKAMDLSIASSLGKFLLQSTIIILTCLES